MKNFNLCLIALIFGSFLFAHSSCHANTSSSIVKYPSNSAKVVPGDDGIDPDWIIFISHFKTGINTRLL